MKVYVPISGGFEDPEPLGVFECLNEAWACLEKSNPMYSTKIMVYETNTGGLIEVVQALLADIAPISNTLMNKKGGCHV